MYITLLYIHLLDTIVCKCKYVFKIFTIQWNTKPYSLKMRCIQYNERKTRLHYFNIFL